MKIINYAHRITESVPKFKFAYADVNDNLKIHLHEQREGKYTFPFNSTDSLHSIFRKFGWPWPNNVSDDEDVQPRSSKKHFYFYILFSLSCLLIYNMVITISHKTQMLLKIKLLLIAS